MSDKEVISAVARALTQYIKLHPCEDDCNVETMECPARRDALDALDKVLHYSLIGPAQPYDAGDIEDPCLCSEHETCRLCDPVSRWELLSPREECDACPDCGPVTLCGKHSRISEAEDESGSKK